MTVSGRGIEVRPGRPADRPAIRALRSALAHPTEDLLAPALERSGSIDGGPVALVAVPVAGTRSGNESDPIGYALVVPGPVDASPAVVTVAELAVAPAARRAGVGTALVEAVAARFGDHDRLRITTRAADDRARDFYRTLGFEVREELDGYYDGEDAVRLDRPVAV